MLGGPVNWVDAPAGLGMTISQLFGNMLHVPEVEEGDEGDETTTPVAREEFIETLQNYLPLFSFYIRKVDKSIRKHSRGKSGKYTLM